MNPFDPAFLKAAAQNRGAARREALALLDRLERRKTLEELPGLLLELSGSSTLEARARGEVAALVASFFGIAGEVLLELGDPAAAEIRLVECCRLASQLEASERARLCRRLAHLRWEQSFKRQGLFLDEAVAWLRRADELAVDATDFDMRGEILLDLGDLYFEDLADLDRAREAYSQLIDKEREPRWHPAWIGLQGLVRVWLHDHRPDLAVQILDSAIRRQGWPRGSRENLILRLWRARALLALDRPARDLPQIFDQLFTLERHLEAALAATVWLRSLFGTSSFGGALATVALLGQRAPVVSREPFEKLVLTARAGLLSPEWLEAQEERLDRAILGRRPSQRGGASS